MKHERAGKIRGVYWIFQINMAFNSNKIEGSQLSREQTQHLFDENKIYTENGESIALDDINETINHFSAFDYILDHVNEAIDAEMIKKIHYLLKNNTSDTKNPLTPVGKFKTELNVIGFNEIPTTHPSLVESELDILLDNYKNIPNKRLEDIVDFHVRFEKIHPFADENGRVGRILAFKELLKHNMVPSIILDQHRHYYILGLQEYYDIGKSRLIDTFKAGQDYCEEILRKIDFKGEINSR